MLTKSPYTDKTGQENGKTEGAGMDDHIAKPIHVDEPLLISKKNCNYSVATVKVLNSYEKFQTKRRVNFFTGFEKISQSFLSPYIM